MSIKRIVNTFQRMKDDLYEIVKDMTGCDKATFSIIFGAIILAFFLAPKILLSIIGLGALITWFMTKYDETP